MKLLFIEPLEVRIAPATLINPTTVVYHDLDGDDVTIKFSTAFLAGPGGLVKANAVLKFDTLDIDADATNDGPQQLQLIDLTGQTATAGGLGITITAKHHTTRGGDGFADVGYLNATGIDLGAISIAGDLGRINAGASGGTGAAIKSLTVQSMGQLGTSTQGASPSLASSFDGGLPSLTVKGHLHDVSISTSGGTTSKIGTFTVGGSDFGANIASAGEIVTLKIGGSLLGGTAVSTGRITSAGGIGSITIGQSMIGTLDSTAVISAAGTIGLAKVGFDLRGGTGMDSGRIETTGFDHAITTASIGGSIVGRGDYSGVLFAFGKLGTVTVGGDIRGGAGFESGQVVSRGDGIGAITIKGSVLGAAGSESGQIVAANGIAAVTIGGSVLGGSGLESGAVECGDDSGTVTITGSLVGYVGSVGDKGEDGAKISADLFKSVTIGGSILGGSGDNSGQIAAGFSGITGNVSVGGSIVGGAGETSGSIQVARIGGSMKVGVDLRGGAGFSSGSIVASDDEIGSVTIGGSVIGGGDDLSGSIRAYTGLKSVTVKGSLIGTAAHRVILSSQYDGGGLTQDIPTIGTVNVSGRVEYAEILAGYVGLVASNADAKIGSVTVGGDWIASSIAAGAQRGPSAVTGDGQFGTADDTINPLNDPPPLNTPHPEFYKSRIGSVVIKGQALGTPGSVSSTDNYGIVAEEIGSIKIGTVSEKLTKNVVEAVALGATGDFIAREDVNSGPAANLPAYAGGNVIKHPTPTTYTYIDVDGDLVTVTTTKPNVLVDADFIRVDAGSGIQVQEIRLANHAVAANNGLGLTIAAVPQKISITTNNVTTDFLLGDGSVNIGYLNATGLDLGAVKVAGDLGRIDAGDNVLTNAVVKSLSAQSMGLFGLTTQAGSANLHSHLRGSIPSISIRGDVLDAALEITGAGMGPAIDNGDLGSLTIGGSLRAGADLAGDVEGSISATGKIGPVTIGHDVVGGDGDNSGRISARSTIGAVKLGGFLQGGLSVTAGVGSGAVVSLVGMTSATVGGDIRGGTKDGSGLLDGAKSIGAVTIKGSLIGGGGEDAGSVIAEALGGKITSVNVAGDVRGGGGKESGYIHSKVTMGAVTIGGSLIGGDGNLSALIYAGSSVIEQHKITSVTIGGDLRGGVGNNSANIGSASGAVGNIANIDIGSITIKGSIVGGVGINSAAITANNIPRLSVGGSLLGGSAGGAGEILATGLLSSATISGSLEGGTANNTGFLSLQKLGTLTISRDLRGGGGNYAGSVFVNTGGATAITFGGSLTSGSGTNAGFVDANGALASLTINGSVFGSAANHVTVQARGMDNKATPLALGKLTIKGSADYLDVFGGRYLASATTTQNGDANVGPITVSGEWTAGNITAGVDPGQGLEFGDDNDAAAAFGNSHAFTSKIASIVIKGRAMGTVGGTEHFGFSSQEIGSLMIGAVKIPLLVKGGNDDSTRPNPNLLNLGPTGDFTAHEVPVPPPPA